MSRATDATTVDNSDSDGEGTSIPQTDLRWFAQPGAKKQHWVKVLHEGDARVPFCRTSPFLRDCQEEGKGVSSTHALFCRFCVQRAPAAVQEAIYRVAAAGNHFDAV